MRNCVTEVRFAMHCSRVEPLDSAPILTAGTAMLGAYPTTLDPVFY